MEIRKELQAEGLVRVLAMVLASLTALLVGLDTQTKKVFFVQKKATVNALPSLWILTIIASVAAGYHLLQLCRCLAFAWLGKSPCGCHKFVAWVCFLLDQGVTYAIFAGTMAATQGSLIAVTGLKQLQWEKLCNIYTKFCVQAAGGILCGLVASLVMVVVSSISAHHLFRLYPSDPRSFSGRVRWSLL